MGTSGELGEETCRSIQDILSGINETRGRADIDGELRRIGDLAAEQPCALCSGPALPDVLRGFFRQGACA